MKKVSFFALLISLFVLSCKKQKSSADYAHKMDGVHKWHGVYDYSYTPAGGSATTEHRFITDSTIEIQVYSDYIVFGTTSMAFESLNTTDHLIRYSVNDPSSLSFYSVTYYYEADSIIYRFSRTLASYNSEHLNLTTP